MTDGKGTPEMTAQQQAPRVHISSAVKAFDISGLDPHTRFAFSMYRDIIVQYERGDDIDPAAYDRAAALVAPILNGGREIGTPVAEELQTSERKPPAAGTAASNQFGTFTVHPLSERQQKFIARLLNERQLPPYSTTVGGMLEHVKLFRQGKLGGKSASRLIDWLLALPMQESTPQSGAPSTPARPPARMATEKQLAHVVKEGARRDYFDGGAASSRVRATVEAATAGQPVSFADASAALDVLFNSAFLPRTRENRAELEAGMYAITRDGEQAIYKVQRAVHGSGQMYAKRLVVDTRPEDPEYDTTVAFEYESGAVNKLTAADRMSLEDAKAFGAIYGVCCNCGRTLTDETSIEAGIGPKCAGRL